MIKCNGKDVIPRLNGKELSRVMYNGKQIYPNVNNNVIEIQLTDAVAGDVCAFDGTNKRFFRFVDSGATDDIKKYTPIGVVVVPASHTDDGTIKCISLASMDYNNPNNGNVENNILIAWGGHNSDILALDDKMVYPAIAEDLRNINGEQQIVGYYQFSNTDAFMPSDYYSDYPNPYDEGTYYRIGTTTNSNYKAMPSPYLTNGSKNEIYHNISNVQNVLADMDGKENTNKILEIDNNVSTDWQTSPTIINNNNSKDNIQPHTAAQCCWRYYTKGTNQGDWYLPSTGELGYLCVRYKIINDAITKIRSYNFAALNLGRNNSLFSSTERDKFFANRLTFSNNNAIFGGLAKWLSGYVRAFIAI